MNFGLSKMDFGLSKMDSLQQLVLQNLTQKSKVQNQSPNLGNLIMKIEWLGVSKIFGLGLSVLLNVDFRNKFLQGLKLQKAICAAKYEKKLILAIFRAKEKVDLFLQNKFDKNHEVGSDPNYFFSNKGLDIQKIEPCFVRSLKGIGRIL